MIKDNTKNAVIAALALGLVINFIAFQIKNPKTVEVVKEVEVIKEVPVEKIVYKDTDCSEFALKHCQFDMAYEAIADSLEFDKGTRFILSEKYFTENKQFCVAEGEDNYKWPCLMIEDVLDKRFFKPVK